MATDQTKSTTRQYVVDLDDGSAGSSRALVYALGAIGGLALGALVVRSFEGLTGGAAARIRDAARERFSPGRKGRTPAATDELMSLEDRVLDAFLGDDVLSGEAIDVGAVAPGIVELSGRASGREELRLALAVAQGIEGVQTVINRMEVEHDRYALHPEDEDDDRSSGAEWTGMRSGMGPRRQGWGTDPGRKDDSQHHREMAVERADRAQFEEEGYHHRPRVADRGGEPDTPGEYAEDELDNQSPYGKHATPAPAPRQAFNSTARVGEGLKPGTELELEGSDVPVKPHQRQRGDEQRGT